MNDETKPYRIETLYLFASINEHDFEGICAIYNSQTCTFMPLITSHEKLLPAMLKQAQSLADVSNQRIELLQFTKRIDKTTIIPRAL